MKRPHPERNSPFGIIMSPSQRIRLRVRMHRNDGSPMTTANHADRLRARRVAEKVRRATRRRNRP